jgi:hypothetical protein
MGNKRGPGNDDDDDNYLSIFNPSLGALFVRLQVMQHFTMTVATRHILQMKQRSYFLASPVNVYVGIAVISVSYFRICICVFLHRVDSTSDNKLLSLDLNSWKGSELPLTILSGPALEFILPSVR